MRHLWSWGEKLKQYHKHRQDDCPDQPSFTNFEEDVGVVRRLVACHDIAINKILLIFNIKAHRLHPISNEF